MFLPDPRLAQLAQKREQQGSPLVHLAVGLVIGVALFAGLVAWATL